MTGKDIQNNFDAWWDKEGSALRPLPEEDGEEHSKRITKNAKNNSSGIKGVSYCNPKKKWIAAISINKNKICIGHFDSFEDAVQARKDKEKEIHGEYAFKN